MKNLEGLMRDVGRTVEADVRRRNLLPEIQRRLDALDAGRAAPRNASFSWRFATVGLGALACGAAAAAILFVVPSRPLSFAVAGSEEARAGAIGEGLVASTARPLAVRFSDGSELTMPVEAKAKVEALDAAGATVALERGTMEVSVVHRAKTRWQIRAGRYQIRVTGTRFSAGWDPGRRALTVTMREGSVLISGPGIKDPIPVVGGQRFKAGEDLEKKEDGDVFLIEDARTPEATAEVAAPAADDATPAPAPEAPEAELAPAAPETPPAAREERTSAPPRARKAATVATPTKLARADAEWRTLAARAQYKEALEAAVQDGWRNNCNRLGAEDVVLLGDVARLAGDLDRAEEAYRAARRRFPGADRPVFALGRIAFERRHDYAAAAAWFESYVDSFPQGPLVREAAGRLLESRLKAGNEAAARAAATSYLRAYPTGPHAALARRTVGP